MGHPKPKDLNGPSKTQGQATLKLDKNNVVVNNNSNISIKLFRQTDGKVRSFLEK